MPRYKKKPVEIDAFRLGIDSMPDWFCDKVTAQEISLHGIGKTLEEADPHCIIRTLEGDMRGDRGDWIIRGVQGEVYPCKHEIFIATYDAVG